ncbi:MAG: autorepressor SdpR family transcription factor [Bacilli bacterium]|jgi:DNA-binding transcriptional ArsR family regulator
MANTAEVLKAMSDKTRRHILELLKQQGRMAAGDIALQFPSMTQATISHHLSILNEVGLIQSEKVGKYIFYEINTTVIQDLLQWIIGLTEGGTNNETPDA